MRISSFDNYRVQVPFRLQVPISQFQIGILAWVVHLMLWVKVRQQQVMLMMFSLIMVEYSMSFLSLSTLDFFAEQVGGTTLNLSYSLRFIVGPLLHA